MQTEILFAKITSKVKREYRYFVCLPPSLLPRSSDTRTGDLK